MNRPSLPSISFVALALLATFPLSGYTCPGSYDKACDSGDTACVEDTADTSASSGDQDDDGYSEDEGDCDDTDDSVNPAATEACNAIDDNCDGYTEAYLACYTNDPREGCLLASYQCGVSNGFGSTSVDPKCPSGQMTWAQCATLVNVVPTSSEWTARGYDGVGR